jgi:UPF0271 protein
VALDLNADLGEDLPDGTRTADADLVEVVTSANVACGFHAGDPATMLRVSELCAARGVAVGAQVSYRDREGFGRRFVDVQAAALSADVVEQVTTLAAIARSAGTRVTYVKPHGALYNTVGHHEAQAAALVDAVQAVDPGLAALGLPGSRWLSFAEEAGLRTVTEAYADRGYTALGTLVPRGEPGALLTDVSAVVGRCRRLAESGEVVAVDGTVVRVHAASICLHGDTPGAVALAHAVRQALAEAGVELAPFAPAGG